MCLYHVDRHGMSCPGISSFMWQRASYGDSFSSTTCLLTRNAIRFGTSHDGSAAINTGAEICAVRMTERVLTADERVRNNFLDAARFKAELPDESCGYKLRESDGALLVHVSAPAVQIEPAGAEPVRAQYSLDGGEWTETLDGWVVADSEATVRVRATDRHYGPTWKEQTLTVSAPRTLSVELVELPPQNTIIVIR